MKATTVIDQIEERTREYATLPLFRAIAEDKIPTHRFSDFFREQYMTARWFQDLIWATTEISDGRLGFKWHGYSGAVMRQPTKNE